MLFHRLPGIGTELSDVGRTSRRAKMDQRSAFSPLATGVILCWWGENVLKKVDLARMQEYLLKALHPTGFQSHPTQRIHQIVCSLQFSPTQGSRDGYFWFRLACLWST